MNYDVAASYPSYPPAATMAGIMAGAPGTSALAVGPVVLPSLPMGLPTATPTPPALDRGSPATGAAGSAGSSAAAGSAGGAGTRRKVATSAAGKASSAGASSGVRGHAESNGTGKVEAPKEGHTLVVDLGKLDLAALKRYKRHYRVRTKHNSTKAELVQAITRHFASQPVMDMDSISFFIYAVKNQEKLLKLKPPKTM